VKRGGNWYFVSNYLSSSYLSNPDHEDIANGGDAAGFRLASSFSTPNPLNLPNFVSVGNPNNDNNTVYERGKALGGVSYVYSIGKYVVTNCEYVEFLNAIASTDTYNVYNPNMTSDARGGITRSGSSGSYSYSIKTNMGNKPVVFVSWFDAARYCNWLHNNKPAGPQDSTTTEDGAYSLNGRIDDYAIEKNSNAKYNITTENEWYKAAYYSPEKGGVGSPGYYTYATQSDTAPTCVTADSIGNGNARIGDYECSPPTITLSNDTIQKYIPVGDTVGELDTIYLGTGSFTYTLVNGNGDTHNSWFTITDNILKTNQYITGYISSSNSYTNEYLIRIRSTSSNSAYIEKSFIITMLNGFIPVAVSCGVDARCYDTINNEFSAMMSPALPGHGYNQGQPPTYQEITYQDVCSSSNKVYNLTLPFINYIYPNTIKPAPLNVYNSTICE
jgi:hypothetical protein